MNILQSKIVSYLAKLAMLPKWLNNDFQKGFTVSQTAEKHGCPESLVWVVNLKRKNDLDKCRELSRKKEK